MLVAVLLFLAAAGPLEPYQARINEGVAALDRNDLSKAQSDFEQATRLSPKNASAWLLLAETYAKQNNQSAARTAAEKAETFGSKEPAILQGLANFYLGMVHDLPKAVEVGARAIRLDPSSEETHFRLAQTYLMLQDFPSAVRVLENARTRFPQSAQITLALGVTYYGLRKFPEAVDQFLRTMKLAPDVPQPYVFLGRIMEHAGDRLPEATQRFAEYQQRNPGNYLGYLLHAKGIVAQLPSSGYPPEAASAYELLQKSLSLKEDEPETHYLLGVLLDRKREFKEAAAHLERSIQLKANDSAVHYRLARVYDRLGRKEEAEQQRAIHEKLSEEEKATVNHGTPVAVPKQ